MITTKCITHGCSNYSNREAGRIICVEPDDDGWICEPCWNFLKTASGTDSVLYQNAHKGLEGRTAFFPPHDDHEHYGMMIDDTDIPYILDELANYDHEAEWGEEQELLNYDHEAWKKEQEERHNALQQTLSSMRVRPVSYYNEVNQTLIDHHT